MRLKGIVVGLFAGLAIAASAQASVAVGNLSRADGSQIIEDSLNHRQWLGWDVTKGLTYAETLAATQAATGLLAGFTFARNLDAQLFVDAMYTTNTCGISDVSVCRYGISSDVTRLVGDSYLLNTPSSRTNEDIVLFLSDNGVSDEVGFISIVTSDVSPDVNFIWKRNEWASVSSSKDYAGFANPYAIGWAMYRQTPASVPEPAPIALLGAGLLGLLATRRKSKKV